MNSLRIRVVILSPLYGVGTEFNHAIQVSDCGLTWWTVARFKEFNEALHVGKQLAEFVKSNQIVKEQTVLWSTKI